MDQRFWLILYCLIYIPLGSAAQHVKWLQANDVMLLNPTSVFSKIDNKVQIFSKHDNDEQCYITLIDEYMNVLSENNLKFSKERKLSMITALETQSGRSFILLNEYDKKAQLYRYYTLEVNEMGKTTQVEKPLFTIPCSKKSQIVMSVDYSEDKSKIAIVINLTEPSQVLTTLDFISYIAVIDGDMDIVYKKKYVMPDMASKVAYVDHWVSETGSLLYYYKLDRSSSSSHWNDDEYINKMIVLDNQGRTIQELAIEDSNVHYTDFKVYPRDNHFMIGGFYSNSDKRGFINGVSMFKIKYLSGEIFDKRIVKFDNSFYKRVFFAPNQDLSVVAGIDKSYKIVDFYVAPNGHTIFVAESFWRELYYDNRLRIMNGFPSDFYYHYYWGNILTFSIDESNKSSWVNIYLKRQMWKSRNEYSSYDVYHRNKLANYLPYSIFTKINHDELDIIFNDTRENYDLQMTDSTTELGKKIKIMTPESDKIPFFYNINLSNGNEVIQPFSNIEKATNFTLYPRMSRKVGSQKLFIYGLENKKEKIGIVEF